MGSKFPTILLLGKNGQVGWELERLLAPWGKIIALDQEGSLTDVGDLTDSEGLRETILRHRPTVIFNAAAYTAVDKAETEIELARQVNAKALKTIGETAAHIGALVVHYSTDYIFNGEGETPYQEDEEERIGPLNVYGQTKLEGEEALRASGARHLIFRTSWVYGVHGKNFMKTVLRLAKTRESLSIVDDQVGTPTSAAFIADVSSALTLRVLAGEETLLGTYHLVPNGTTSWYGFAHWILENAQNSGNFAMMPDRLQAIPTKAYPTPALRPLNSRLDNTKLTSILPEGSIREWHAYALRALSELTEKL